MEEEKKHFSFPLQKSHLTFSKRHLLECQFDKTDCRSHPAFAPELEQLLRAIITLGRFKRGKKNVIRTFGQNASGQVAMLLLVPCSIPVSLIHAPKSELWISCKVPTVVKADGNAVVYIR